MKKNMSWVLGIDVSKATLDCALLRWGQQKEEKPRCWRCANSAAGYAEILRRLERCGVRGEDLHAILEATNIYSQVPLEVLHAAGIKTSLVNPRQVKDFARSLNLRAKTDAIDARLLARYGAEREPRATMPPSPTHKLLHAWVNELDALVEEGVRLRGRRESTREAAVLAFQEESLADLKRRIARLEERIGLLLQSDPALARAVHLLTTIPGIATRTAVRILSQIADKSFGSARALAAYAGLTPKPHQSGTSVRRPTHISKIGNARLRRCLYMPASVAVRCCLPLSQWANALKARGKSAKAVRVAVMRRLLHIIFGVLKHDSHFDPQKAAFTHLSS